MYYRDRITERRWGDKMFLKKLGMTIFFMAAVFLFMSVGNSSTQSMDTQDIRTVYVKAVADEEYIALKGEDWRDEIKTVVEKASQAFERQFGIKFVLKVIGEWNSEHVDAFYWRDLTAWVSWFDLASTVKLEDCDILIGFTAQFHGGCSVFGATVIGQTNIILIKDFLSFLRDKWGLGQNSEPFMSELLWKNGPISEYQYRILVHEFGRAFGAEDTEEFSVMNGKYLLKTAEFDPENKKRILENKWRDF